jgi:hypothetical protein
MHIQFSDNALSRTNRYLDIIGATKDYREGTIQVQLKQNGNADSDVSISKGKTRLGTQYGESIE